MPISDILVMKNLHYIYSYQ